jgi:succinoglycan biosynthesis transport protein ExoP
MTDSIEEQGSEQLDFRKYLNIARRRQLYFIVPMFLVWLIVFGASFTLHPRYNSTTLILVEEPTMPKNYVAPNVSQDLQDRLQSMTQQIMSRTRLLTIIDKLQLYRNGSGNLSDDARVDMMRKDITIELVRDSRNNEITAFRIIYSSQNPHVAQAVTSALKDLFINETLLARQQESEGTTKFIEKQLADASAQLAQQEAKVHIYEAAHEGALPTQSASNLQILSGLQSQLQNEQDSLNAAKQQRVLLQSQIQQYKSAPAATKSVDGVPTGVGAVDIELAKLRAQLVDLSSRYTDSYPDVKKLKQQIAETQRIRDQMAASAKSASDASPDSDVATPGSPLAQLQSQLQANKLEISNREQGIAGLQARIGQYEARLNESPATEQQLAELNRGYDQSKANYDDLLKKKNESAMATDMETMQQGERFTMLDPPSLPGKPYFPNRIKFCMMGLGIGMAIGLVVAGGFEFLDDRIHSEKEIKNLLPISVISEIPDVVMPSDEAKSRRLLVLNWAATAVALFVILAAAAVSYLRG